MNSKLEKLLDEGIVKEVIELNKYSKYKKGNFYWNGYWHQYYKVLNYVLDDHKDKYGNIVFRNDKPIKRLKSVTVKWQDGRITAYCTCLDPLHDYELIMRGDLYD